ncbi:hypothetical protein MMC22_010404 [Lobaria immixta]|nr:hypothetical protein [Lobaria immixta]
MTKFSIPSRLVLLAVHVISFCHPSSAGICSTGIYKDLLFLSDYAPAKSYCSIHYPVLPASVTITAAGAVEKGYRRRNLQRAATTSEPAAGVEARWSSLLASAPAILGTITITPPKTKSFSLPSTRSSSKSSTSTRKSSSTTTKVSSKPTARSSTKTTIKPSTTSSNPTSTTSTNGPACTAGTQPTFVLLASGSNTTDDGQYALQSNVGDDVVTFGPRSAATSFFINSVSQLIGLNCEIANIASGSDDSSLFFDSAAVIAANNFVPASCKIASGALQCADQTANVLFVCTNALEIEIGAVVPSSASAGNRGACHAVTLTPVFQ